MRTSALLSLTALSGLLTLSGCASKEVDPTVRSAYDNIQTSLKNKPVGIVGDGCLVRIEMGKDDIMYQHSDLASIAMANTVSTHLDKKGVQIASIQTPFVCGIMDKDKLLKLDILTTADAKDQKNTTYPILSSSNTFDTTINQAYLNLYQAIEAATQQAKTSTAGESISLNLDESSLAILKQTTQADKVFVTFVSGKKPSFGASMALATVTVLASGGTMGYTLQEGQFYNLYLLDLSENKILWSKNGTVQGKVFKMPVNESFNQPELLEPLYAE